MSDLDKLKFCNLSSGAGDQNMTTENNGIFYLLAGPLYV